jgi:hypothetical protein
MGLCSVADPDPYKAASFWEAGSESEFYQFFFFFSFKKMEKKVSKPNFVFYLHTRLMMGRVVEHGQSWSNVHFLQLKMLQQMAEPQKRVRHSSVGSATALQCSKQLDLDPDTHRSQNSMRRLRMKPCRAVDAHS